MNIPQNQLMNNIWQHNTRSIMPEFIRIIGRVVGEVTITDINKKIAYNQILDLNVNDVLQSKDFEIARRERWIEVLQGKHILEKGYSSIKQVVPQQQPQQNVTNVQNIQIDMNEIKNTVAQTTKETVQSILGEVLGKLNEIKTHDVSNISTSSTNTNIDIDKLANAIAGKISVSGQAHINKQEIDKLAESVFIDVDSVEIEKNSNLNSVGKTKGEKSNISGTLEKMKKFKKKN